MFPIRIPALRERPEDVAPLVAHFAARYAARFARTITLIDKRSLKAMEAHAWPGNVRELENLVERAVIVSRHGKLAVDRDALTEFPAGSLSADLQSREREAIEAALHGSAARISGPNGAAARLGIPPSTLESRIRRLGIDKFRYRRVP